MKLIAIGDIHGCLDELVELYGKLSAVIIDENQGFVKFLDVKSKK